MDASIVRLTEISKTFTSGWRKKEVQALRGVSFSIPRGSICGLLGPNGSGKSTAIKILLGIIQPTSGRYDIDLSSAEKDFREQIGYLPEAPYFYKHLSPRELLGAYASLYHQKISCETIDNALEQVGLREAKDRLIKTFSKGMLQRLGLAQAIMHDPEFLLLDEPTAGMDPLGVKDFARIILNEHQKGKTILLCSHLLSQMEALCTHAVILHEGKVICEQPMEQLLSQDKQEPAHTVRVSSSQMEKMETFFNQEGIAYESCLTRETSLEHIFMKLIEKNR